MRSPSPRVLANRVDWYQLTPTYDNSGALLASSYPSTPTQSSIPCTAQLKMVERVIDDQQRVTSLYAGKIGFASDIGLKENDKLVWTGPVRTHNLFVTGTIDNAGRGAFFTVPVEERV